MSTRKRFLHFYKECFVLFSNRCGISQSTPWWLVSSLAHSSESDFDTICNRPNPPLADCPFGLLRIVVNLTVLKHVYQREICIFLYNKQISILLTNNLLLNKNLNKPSQQSEPNLGWVELDSLFNKYSWS